MRYRALDENGDMTPVLNNPVLVGADAVAQALKTRLMMFTGEWWENKALGIPLDALLGANNAQRISIADAYIKQQIINTDGVASIQSYTSVVDETRVRLIHISVNTTNDETVDMEVSF